nr:hypothetical protein [Pseudomonas sp. NFACC45]
MPDNQEAQIATADALTLLLHNQHALAAGWKRRRGDEVASRPWKRKRRPNAVAALETLDRNAIAITDAIMRLRRA